MTDHSRRWVQFNLRHVLLLVAAIALLLAWWKPFRRDFQIAVQTGKSSSGVIESIRFGWREYTDTEEVFAAVRNAAAFRMVKPEDIALVVHLDVDESLRCLDFVDLLHEFNRTSTQFIVRPSDREQVTQLEILNLFSPDREMPFPASTGSPDVDPFPPLEVTLRDRDYGRSSQIEVGDARPPNWSALRSLIEERYIKHQQRSHPDLTYCLDCDTELSVSHLLNAMEVCCMVRDKHQDEATIEIRSGVVTGLATDAFFGGGLGIPFSVGPGSAPPPRLSRRVFSGPLVFRVQLVNP